MKKYLLLCLSLACFFNCIGQGENNVWVFGNQTGLNFNNTPPTLVTSSIETFEGAASICDAAGNLLFYSNSDKVWDRTHTPMPNGTGLIGNGFGYAGGPIGGSSEQGVSIVRATDNPDRYYLFTLDCAEQIGSQTNGKLRYSIIDMSLNGGLGDVVAGSKNIVVDSFLSEKMTVIAGDACDAWVLAYKYDGRKIMAYRIDNSGVHPGVASNSSLPIASNTGSHLLGQMNASADGNLVGISYYNSNQFEVATFNKTTGMLSNFMGLQAGSNIFGLELSPDGSKIYVAEGFSTIRQFDLAAYPNAATVQGTMTSISGTGFSSNSSFYSFRRGPDNNIYVVSDGLQIGRITNPDQTPPSCQLSYFITLPSAGGFGIIWSIGNNVLTGYTAANDTVSTVTDTLFCHDDTLTWQVNPDYLNVSWNDGSTAYTREITEGGLYVVRYETTCGRLFIDTINAALIPKDLNYWNDTAICQGHSITLAPAVTDADSYLWSTGSTAPAIQVSQPGTYTLEFTKRGCTAYDTITIGTVVPQFDIRETDTIICEEKPLVLHTTSEYSDSIYWSTGVTFPELPVIQTGIYVAYSKTPCGVLTDTVSIEAISCTCRPFVPNVFSPNNDNNNDRFKIEMRCTDWSQYAFRVYNRFGQCVFTGWSPEDTWDGTFNGQPCDVGTYFYHFRYIDIRRQVVEKHGDIVLLR